MTPAGFRRALARTYYAFFGRHAMPRPIQLDSAVPLIGGRDALLTAPAASGKTEAYAAPLCERFLAEGWQAPAILILSPTRALANDLARRLRGPADALGISLGRWTGERKEPAAGGLPAVTILTPEALDARLSRGPAALRSVRAAVLDELHILDGTTRGDHLRILVSRLRRLAPIQVVAASATVADPESMAGRYLRDAAIVRDPRPLRIRARIVGGAAPGHVAGEIVRLARAGARKFLVFANRRDTVEAYAAALANMRPFRGRVFAHHGSLSKRERERAEREFLSSPRALCFATMTLELGIDIGDVDVVGLLDPPADVAGLLQRIGRSGRRGQGPKAVAFAENAGDAFRYRSMLALAREGDLAADPPRFRPSVLVQQALSILHQNPGLWIRAASIHSRLDQDLAREWTEHRLNGVLARLAEKGWLEPAGPTRYVEGIAAEDKWARGTLHSNIADTGGLDVVDQLTGETIGEVAKPDEDEQRMIRIGGRARKIVWQGERRIVVRGGEGGKTPIFAPRGVPIVSRRLAQELARRLGLEEGEWPVLLGGADPNGPPVRLFHFLGSAGGEVVAAAIQATFQKAVAGSGPFAVILNDPFAAWIPEAEVKDLEAFCRDRRDRLAKVLGMGPYHHLLPQDEADRAIFEAADLPGLSELISRARICEVRPGISQEILEGLTYAGSLRGVSRSR